MFAFCWEIIIIISKRAPNKLFTINPAIMENTEYTIIKVRTPVIKSRCVTYCLNTVYHYTPFRFQLSESLANISIQEY